MMNLIKCKDCGEELKANALNPRPSDCQLIAQVLDKARPWGLEAEVMWSAMVIVSEANKTPRHGETMQEVLEAALEEWDL